MLPSAHSFLRSWIVVDVLPEPFGPATMQSVGRIGLDMIAGIAFETSNLFSHSFQPEIKLFLNSYSVFTSFFRHLFHNLLQLLVRGIV